MSELAYRIKEHAGASRRIPVWRTGRSLQAEVTPVPAGRPPIAPAPATAPKEMLEPSAVLHAGIRSVPSTSHPHGTAHLRPAVKVPVRLSLAGLGAVTGSVSVHVTISSVTPAAGDVSVSLAWAEVGGVSVCPTLKRTGSTFAAAFICSVGAGTTQLDVDLGGHSYRGRNTDHRDFAVNVEVIFQEQGKQAPTVLFSGAMIHL